MLVKKNNDSSAVVVPLVTGYSMFGADKAFNGEETFALQPMISTDKIVFPGTNALVYAEHQTFDTATNKFIGINQGNNSNKYGGTGAGDSWGYDVDLNTRLTGTSFRKGFNRLNNWCDFAQYPGNESANYLEPQGSSQRKVYYKPKNVVTEYYRKVGSATLPRINEDSRVTAQYYYDLYWKDATDFTIHFTGQNAAGQLLGYVTNNAQSGYNFGERYSAAFTADASGYPVNDFRGWSQEYNKKPVYYEKAGSYGYYEYISFPLDEQLYYSGITAKIQGLTYRNISEAQYVTGYGDVSFKFDVGGSETAWIAPTGSAYLTDNPSVTAEVRASYLEFISAVNRVSSNRIWNWEDNFSGSTAELSYGGGGGFNYSLDFYTLYSNKYVLNPKNQCEIYKGDSGRYYTITAHDKIPDYLGGSMIFSATGLDDIWENDNRLFFIGFKGINTKPIGNYWTDTTDNYEGKFYKFNSDHFKKIRRNCYYFYDDKICKLYSYAENDNSSGKQEKTILANGPFFWSVTANTYKTTVGSDQNYTFLVDNENHDGEDYMYQIIKPPIVFDSIQYVTPADPENNTDYIVTKPANSISFASDGTDKNQGNLDDYSYIAIRYPTYSTETQPLYLNTNITEITKLGKSLRSFTAIKMQSNQLVNLTAIKDSWGWGMNLRDLDSTFSGATALKSIPNSWSNLSNLTSMRSTFYGCKSLTSIPSWHPLQSLKYTNGAFVGCTSLSSVPNGPLPALIESQSMFEKCYSITSIPDTWYWLKNCTNMSNMFSDCTSLTDIPTDLFDECTSLTYLTAMFSGCTALTSDVKPIMDAGNAKFGMPDYDGIRSVFKGCTGVSSYNTLTANPNYKLWFGIS